MGATKFINLETDPFTLHYITFKLFTVALVTITSRTTMAKQLQNNVWV